MTHLEILKSMRKLLSQPSAWNQRNYAVNKEALQSRRKTRVPFAGASFGAVARSEESPNDTWQILGFSPENRA